MYDLIKSSDFGLFTDYGYVKPGNGIEIDRIEEKINGQVILSLRVRNSTAKPVKIFSFMVSEFTLPANHKIEKVLEHGWLQCSEVSYKKLDQPTKESKVFLQRDQNHFSFQKEYGYVGD